MIASTHARALAAVATAVVASVVPAARADAHATFAEVGVPADSEQTITMFVPEERGPDVHNAAVDLRVPAGWSALGCQQIAPWTCQVADGGVIRWTKATGAAPSDADTMFLFTVRTGPPGTVSVPVVQTYDTSEVVRWIGPADSEEPAAFIDVLPQGAPVPPTTALTTTTTTAAPAPTSAATTRPAATTTRPAASTAPAPAATTSTTPATTLPPETSAPTTAVAETTTTTADDERDGEVTVASAEGGDGGGSALLVVLGGLAVAGAVAASVLWRRRRPGPAGPDA